MYTTLNKIRAHGPCMHGWETLLRSLGKTRPDDEPVSVVTVLKSNGLDDAIWCLRAVDGFDREKRLFAVKCARRVQHLLKDQRSVNALDVSEAYANGLASAKELRKACEDAWAAWADAWAASGSTWAVSGAARAARAANGAAAAALEQAWEAAWQATGATLCAVEVETRGELGVAPCDAACVAERGFQANLFVEMFSSTQEEK